MAVFQVSHIFVPGQRFAVKKANLSNAKVHRQSIYNITGGRMAANNPKYREAQPGHMLHVPMMHRSRVVDHHTLFSI